jgi:hypothetical protein
MCSGCATDNWHANLLQKLEILFKVVMLPLPFALSRLVSWCLGMPCRELSWASGIEVDTDIQVQE